ncbi:MAG: hypothetical protein ACI9ES_000786 [Oceanospirillaceae bacterium]|jgi:hypothetical protein
MTFTFKKSLFTIAVLVVAGNVQADAFQRIASWSTAKNLTQAQKITTETSAEIITASKDGNRLIYSDSPRGGLGFIDITQADQPKAAGFIALQGEPTSVTASTNYAYAAVNSSANFTQPSGFLASIDLTQLTVADRCDLGGQPDSVAISKDEKYIAIAIENERDEDLNDGSLGQLPAGTLVILPVEQGVPNCSAKKVVDLTGLAAVGPSDPEPEFVDFNDNNEIVVTLQENNHLVIIDASSAKVTAHFSAGEVDLKGIDVTKDGAIRFDSDLTKRKREPDAVQWLDNERFVTANEGDYQGGSRGFTIFNKQGKVLFDSATELSYQIASAGHYPDKRSAKKGVEPEGLEVATYGDTTYIFVMAERANVVAVYKDTGAAPEFVQLLPTGIAPEGAIAITGRNLFVTANEKDLIAENGPRSHVMLYQLGADKASYPQLQSKVNGAQTITWGALSGMVADPQQAGILYAVNDSYYRNDPAIFTIDANKTPALIVKKTAVTRAGMPAQKLDMEGITTDGKGGFWVSSEGKNSKLVPHALYNINAEGEIKQEVAFPEALLAVQKRFGAEGITRIGDTLWIAIQRAWQDDAKNMVKLVAYHTNSKTWGAVLYPTETTSKGWVGLSEISAFGDQVYIVERDNQIGEQALIKRLYKVSQTQLQAAPLGEPLPIVEKKLVRDFITDLQQLNGYVVDKIEGFAIDVSGTGYAITDNDGVDDSSGETYFFSTGKMQ